MTTPLTPEAMEEALRFSRQMRNDLLKSKFKSYVHPHSDILQLTDLIDHQDKALLQLKEENERVRKALQRIKDSAECRHAIEIASGALAASPNTDEQ